MDIKMIPRKCSNPLCDQVFRVSHADLITKFHLRSCKELYESKVKKGHDFKNDPRVKECDRIKEEKCLAMVNLEKMEESGMEDGELQSNLKEEKKSNVKESENQKSFKQGEIETRNTLQILRIEKSISKNNVKDTMPIESETPEEKPNGEEETRKGPMNTKELTTVQTSQLSSQESLKQDSEETHSLGSSQLSIALKEEKENSIGTLNESSKLLLNYAKGLMKTKADFDGEPISRPMTGDVMAALQCVEAVRNIQKTKLDFLKFAREIQKDIK